MFLWLGGVCVVFVCAFALGLCYCLRICGVFLLFVFCVFGFCNSVVIKGDSIDLPDISIICMDLVLFCLFFDLVVLVCLFCVVDLFGLCVLLCWRLRFGLCLL